MRYAAVCVAWMRAGCDALHRLAVCNGPRPHPVTAVTRWQWETARRQLALRLTQGRLSMTKHKRHAIRFSAVAIGAMAIYFWMASGTLSPVQAEDRQAMGAGP